MSVHDASQRSLFPAIAVPRVAKRRLSPGPNLAHHDLIMTPPELARRIVDYYAPRGRLLDPCRGQGAFYNAMLSHSDDVRWCEVAEGRNFFTYREPVTGSSAIPPGPSSGRSCDMRWNLRPMSSSLRPSLTSLLRRGCARWQALGSA